MCISFEIVLVLAMTFSSSILKGTFPIWPLEWQIRVSFEVLFAASKTFIGIVHFTNIDGFGYGDRLPSIMYRTTTSEIEITWENNANDESAYARHYHTIERNVIHHLKIAHVKRLDKYKLEVYLNTRKIFSQDSPAPRVWNDVRYYTGTAYGSNYDAENSIRIDDYVAYGMPDT